MIVFVTVDDVALPGANEVWREVSHDILDVLFDYMGLERHGFFFDVVLAFGVLIRAKIQTLEPFRAKELNGQRRRAERKTPLPLSQRHVDCSLRCLDDVDILVYLR